MWKLFIFNISWVVFLLLLLFLWVIEKKVCCDVYVEIYEIYRIDNELFFCLLVKVKVKYGFFDGLGNFFFFLESEEINVDGWINFLVVENIGIIVKY